MAAGPLRSGIADEQFLERCGENLIQVDYARAIVESVSARSVKERSRRAAASGQSTPRDDASSTKSADASSTPDKTASNMPDIKSTLAESTRTALANAEAEVLGEEPPEADEPKSFTSHEVDTLLRKQRSNIFTEAGVQIHVIAGQKYIKLKDLLPPTPPRGEFDVEKTRTSQYFFS